MHRNYGRISTLSFPILSIYPTFDLVKIRVSN